MNGLSFTVLKRLFKLYQATKIVIEKYPLFCPIFVVIP